MNIFLKQSFLQNVMTISWPYIETYGQNWKLNKLGRTIRFEICEASMKNV